MTKQFQTQTQLKKVVEEKIKEIEDVLKRVEIEYRRYGDNEIIIKGIVTKSILSRYPELVIKRRSTIIKITVIDMVIIYIEDEEKHVEKQIVLPPYTFIDYQYPNLRITF